MSARRFVTAERKSFDLVLEGVKEDLVRISENGRGRRTTIILNATESEWVQESWQQAWTDGSPNGWFRRRRVKNTTLMLQIQQNKRGRMATLTVIKERSSRLIIIPEGDEQRGWRDISNALADLVALTKVPKRMDSRQLQGRVRKPVVLNFNNNGSIASKGNGVQSLYDGDGNSKINLEACCPNCGSRIVGEAQVKFRRAEKVQSGEHLDSGGQKEQQNGGERVVGRTTLRGHGDERQYGQFMRIEDSGVVEDRGGTRYNEVMVTDGGDTADFSKRAALTVVAQKQGHAAKDSNFEFQLVGPRDKVGPRHGPGQEWRIVKGTNFRQRGNKEVESEHTIFKDLGQKPKPLRVGSTARSDEYNMHVLSSPSFSISRDLRKSSKERKKKSEAGEISTGEEVTAMRSRRSYWEGTGGITQHKRYGKVYQRRQKGEGIRSVDRKGIHFYEAENNRSCYATKEWNEKLKGLQRVETDSSSDFQGGDYYLNNQDGCSLWSRGQPLSSTPVAGENSEFEDLGFASEVPDTAFNSPSSGETIERYASKWVLENIQTIGKALGLSYAGREREVVGLFESIENKRLTEACGDLNEKNQLRVSQGRVNQQSGVNYGRNTGEDGKVRRSGTRAKGHQRKLC